MGRAENKKRVGEVNYCLLHRLQKKSSHKPLEMLFEGVRIGGEGGERGLSLNWGQGKKGGPEGEQDIETLKKSGNRTKQQAMHLQHDAGGGQEGLGSFLGGREAFYGSRWAGRGEKGVRVTKISFTMNGNKKKEGTITKGKSKWRSVGMQKEMSPRV